MAADKAQHVVVEPVECQDRIRPAGACAPAIYRRWPSRIELIEEAAFSGLPSH